jgi:hypothetical protein
LKTCIKITLLFVLLAFLINPYSVLSQTLLKPNKDILPVELVYFFAYPLEESVLLKWGTATEVSNYGFQIERSLLNSEFQSVGFVLGSGNSNSPKHYQFIDSTLEGDGRYSYRLKQFDTDGNSKFSDTVKIDIGPTNVNENNIVNDYKISNFPNPFNSSTRITYSIPYFSPVTIDVLDFLGRKIQTIVKTEKESGVYTYNWNPENLSTGIYFIRFSAGNFNRILKLVMIK